MENRSGLRVFRFRLQTMWVVITIFAILLGLVTQEWHREQRKKRNAAEVQRLGGRVGYNSRPEHEPTGVVNGYLRIILGDDYFTEVDSVHLKPRAAVDLDLLLAFPEMKRLSMIGAPVTDESIEKLKGFSHLERLYLVDAALGERGVKSLTELPKLQSLSFENCSLADQSFKSLAKFPNLNSLDFKTCLLSDALLKSLTQSSKLDLSFSDGALTDSNLKSLHGAQSSVNLRLFKMNVTEAGILAAREANPTWSVRFSGQSLIQGTQTEFEGYLPSIQEMPQIDKLTFKGPLTSAATLAVLKDARNLTSLQLESCSLTDSDLQHLIPLQNLTSLNISGAPITDEGVRALEGLRKLEVLEFFSDATIEGLGLGSLPSSITTLRFYSSGVTDRGVAEIAKLTYLQNLSLAKTLVSDEGIDDLAKLTSLRNLYIRETRITASGASRLQRALPNCSVFPD